MNALRSSVALTLTIGLAAASSAAPPRIARAQDNAAAIEALFSAGKKLMADGKFGEACPKFLASYNLEHRIGTVLNLADCYEKNGQLASAWARFVEARTLAQRAGQAEREAFASEHAKGLEPKLSTLAIVVPSPPPGLAVERDGVKVEAGAYGVAVAIDGGPHEITASAPGMKPWTGHVTVGASLDRQSVTVPALEAAPVAATVPLPGSNDDSGRTRRYVGMGVGALGIVATRSTAVSDGTASTVLIGVGAAAVVGGAILWFTGRPASTTTVGFDGRSLLLSGSF
jgi:hypothetical protein